MPHNLVGKLAQSTRSAISLLRDITHDAERDGQDGRRQVQYRTVRINKINLSQYPPRISFLLYTVQLAPARQANWFAQGTLYCHGIANS